MVDNPPFPSYHGTSTFFPHLPLHVSGTQIMSPPAAHRPGSAVRFTEAHMEYPVFKNDPPALIQGRYQPPATPFIGARSLPGTPELRQDDLEEVDEYVREDESESAPGRCDGARTPNDGMDYAYGTANPTPTPSNSPAAQTARICQVSPTPSLSSASSPSPEPAAHTELSPYLRRFPLKWNVRKKRLADLRQTNSEGLNAHAFETRRKSCVLHFVPPDKHAESNAWYIRVGPRLDHRPLSVLDVVSAVDNELYSAVEESGLGPTNGRYQDARTERLSRLQGPEDAAAVPDVFRNIDFYPRALRYFHGIEEMSDSEDGYVVCVGQTHLVYQ